MTKHSLKVSVLAMVLVFSFFILFTMMEKKPGEEKKSSALIAAKAPSFRALRLQEESSVDKFVELHDYLGKPLILSFWASWCSVCREEGLYLQLKKDSLEETGKLEGVEFLRIAVSDSYEDVKKHLSSQKNLLETAFDKSGLIAVDYGLTGVPETFFISRDGVILYRHRGPLTEEIFETYFEKITEKKEAFASHF